MLSSIVPGIRELRAPLAAGYIWLLFAWLIIEPSCTVGAREEGICRLLTGLVAPLDALGLGLAVSFLAYLVGSLSDSLSWMLALLGLPVSIRYFGASRFQRRVIFPVRRLFRRIFAGEGPSHDISWKGVEAIRLVSLSMMENTEHEFDQHGTSISERPSYRRIKAQHWPDRADDDVLSGDEVPYWLRQEANEDMEELGVRTIEEFVLARHSFVAEIANEDNQGRLTVREATKALLIADWVRRSVDELELMAMRLVGREPELFGQYDRIRSEAQLRRAIIPPLLAVIGTLTVKLSPWWFAALPAIIVLYRQSATLQQKAGGLLADALKVGRVQSPTLEQVAHQTEEAVS